MMFGWFQTKTTKEPSLSNTSYKHRSQRQQQQPLPSSKLYDLCIDRDWQAVNDHAIQHPIDCSFQDFHGHDGGATPLMMACEDRAPLDTIQILLQAWGESTRIANRNGNIPLHVACHCGAYKDVLQALLDQDIESVFCQTKWGKTPLTALCDGFTSSHLEIPEELMWSKIQVLLKAVAQCEKLQKERTTNHKRNNHPPTTRNNDHPNTINDDNDPTTTTTNHKEEEEDCLKEEWHLLHAAVSLGAIGCPKQAFDMTLAKHPHAVFQRDSHGRLPLHIAVGPCQWRWPKLKRAYKPREGYVIDALLLRHREAARIPDPHDGRMPLHLALANGHTWEGGVEALFGAAPEYISVEDPVTGLVPFLLAAVPVGETNTSLTTIYSLLCAQPDLLSSFDFQTVPPPLDSEDGDTNTKDGQCDNDNNNNRSTSTWTSKWIAASFDRKHLATFVAFSAVAIACVRSIILPTTAKV